MKKEVNYHCWSKTGTLPPTWDSNIRNDLEMIQVPYGGKENMSAKKTSEI